MVINSVQAFQLASRTGLHPMVIPNVMDFDSPPPPLDDYARSARADLGVSPAQHLVLQPTRIIQRKGIEHSIELVRRLGLPAVLVISHASGDEGSAYEKRLREFAALLNVTVNFESKIVGPKRDLNSDGQKVYTLGDIYPHADLVTYPSSLEGFGNAFLEAIYYKRPLVVNNYSIFEADIKPKGFQVIEFDGFISEKTLQDTCYVLTHPQQAQAQSELNYDSGPPLLLFYHVGAQVGDTPGRLLWGSGMKIALLHYSAPPVVGGVEFVLAQHARQMVRAGHAVTIFAGRGEAFDARIGVRILPRLDSRHAQVLEVKKLLDGGKYTPAFDALRDEIREEMRPELAGFDLLVAHNVASLHKNLPLTAALWQLSGTQGFPRLVLWHHDLAWTTPRYRAEMHPGYPWDLLRARWECATHVVVSAQRRQELCTLTGLPVEAVRVIPNGVDLNAFFKLEPPTIQWVEQLHLLEADPLLLLPVRLTPRKNIELALRVLAELRAGYPQAALVVTGPEGAHNPANAVYKQELLALRSELGLQGAAHFLAELTPEFQPDAVIADFYRLADALIFPSNEEGFGIPIIEAAFSAMPVFCADIPVLRELGGEDLSYFDPQASPRSIAAQISQRLESEPTVRWSRRARHIYAWNSIYARWIEPLIQEN